MNFNNESLRLYIKIKDMDLSGMGILETKTSSYSFLKFNGQVQKSQ